MKVVITEDKRAQYEALFGELHDLTQAEIQSLPQYYKALKQRFGGETHAPNKFYRLPLDEEPMRVDLDSRMISVPTAFANNGIGVAGDANAELIFFKVDRWYDNTDLYDLVAPSAVDPKIRSGAWVQWRHTTNNVSGNSKVIFCDATEDTMWLGWLITEKMTQAAGTLEFSLRFFRIETNDQDVDEITYSLSTQKTSCTVKQTLNLSVEDPALAAEDMTDLVYKRPLYSGVINTMNGASPIIIRTLDNSTPRELVKTVPQGEDFEDYLDYLESLDAGVIIGTAANVETNYPEGYCLLSVEANPADENSTLTYRWYNGSNVLDAAYNQASYAANIAGVYSVDIGNISTDGNGETIGTRWTRSPAVVIPRAQELAFGQTTQPLGVYSRDPDEASAPAVSLSVNVVAADTKRAPEHSTLEYVWKKKSYITAGNGGTGVVLSPNAVAVENSNTATLTLGDNDEGEYSCEIVNHRNNTVSETLVLPNPILVRAKPDQATSVTVVGNVQEKKITVSSVTFPANSPSAAHTEEWYYQWYVTGGPNPNSNYSIMEFTKNDTFTFDHLAPMPYDEGNNLHDYGVYCKMIHKVWGEEGHVGETLNSDAQTSNVISLHIYKDQSNNTVFQIVS